MVGGHEPFPCFIAQHGPLAAHGLGDEKARRPGVGQGRRVKLKKFQVRNFRVGPVGHGHAVAHGPGRVGRNREKPAGPAAGQNGGPGQNDPRRPIGKEDQGAGAAPVGRKEVNGHCLCQQADLRLAGNPCRQGLPDELPGGVAAGMQDAVPAVRAFPSQGKPAVFPIK